MKKRIRLKPARKVTVNLFANTAEAVVFWVSVAGVLLILILGCFDYFRDRKVKSFLEEYRGLQERVVELEREVNSLKAYVRQEE